MQDITSLFGSTGVDDILDFSNYFSIDLYNKSYKLIKPEDRMPICIPSYNNFDSTTMKLLSSSNLEWPIYIIVRKSQAEKYTELYGIKAKIISVDDNLIDSGTRAKKYIFENFKGDIFQFDDDLVSLTYCKPEYTSNNKLKTKFIKDVDPIRVVAMWQIVHKEIMNKYKDCWATEPSRNLYVWSYDIVDNNIDLAVNSQPSSVFAVNLDILSANDVFIDDEISADDICTYWLALDKGLWPAQIKFITCELGKPRLEHYGKGCNSLKERFKMQSDELFAKYNYSWSRRKNHKVFGDFYSTNTKDMRLHLMSKGTFPSDLKIDFRKLSSQGGM